MELILLGNEERLPRTDEEDLLEENLSEWTLKASQLRWSSKNRRTSDK